MTSDYYNYPFLSFIYCQFFADRLKSFSSWAKPSQSLNEFSNLIKWGLRRFVLKSFSFAPFKMSVTFSACLFLVKFLIVFFSSFHFNLLKFYLIHTSSLSLPPPFSLLSCLTFPFAARLILRACLSFFFTYVVCPYKSSYILFSQPIHVFHSSHLTWIFCRSFKYSLFYFLLSTILPHYLILFLEILSVLINSIRVHHFLFHFFLRHNSHLNSICLSLHFIVL